MSILTRIGIPLLLKAAVDLVVSIVDRIYDYKEKKLQLKFEDELKPETFEDEQNREKIN